MGLYMLYRSKAKNTEELDKLRLQFEEIYKRNKVDIVGFWTNADAEDEFFYMSRYKDEADYKNTVERLRKDEDYIRLGHELKEARLDFESTRLIPKWIPE
ncbi:MAG: NIPSNAP family protein [Candidatus Thorarchaeota archaeon]|nr:NIPSNAP family protein [Candidatus Thorarchaeota archaeon]